MCVCEREKERDPTSYISSALAAAAGLLAAYWSANISLSISLHIADVCITHMNKLQLTFYIVIRAVEALRSVCFKCLIRLEGLSRIKAQP